MFNPWPSFRLTFSSAVRYYRASRSEGITQRIPANPYELSQILHGPSPPPLSGHPPLQEFSIRIHNCFLVYGDSRWRNPPSLEPDNEAPHFPPRRDLRTLPFECLPLAARSRDKRTGRSVESSQPRSAVLRSFVAIVNLISHIFLLSFFFSPSLRCRQKGGAFGAVGENCNGFESVEGNRAETEARARASSLFISIDRGGWCGIADRLWREKEIDERVSWEVWGRAREKELVQAREG